MRPNIPLGILLGTLLARPLCSQGKAERLEGILRAEDGRAARAAELQQLLDALRSADTLILERALRAIGRLERPALVRHLVPLLAHPLPGVRAEAAQAVAQAAQGFRGDSAGRARSTVWPALVTELGRRSVTEEDPVVRGMLALSLGRLPYGSPDELLQAESWLVGLAPGLAQAGGRDVARGMESFARNAGRRLQLGEPFLAPLRGVTRDSLSEPRTRRAALGALLAAQASDRLTVEAAALAADPQLRRLALIAAGRLVELEARDRWLRQGLRDTDAQVRYEALRLWTRSVGVLACAQLLEATRDSMVANALLAIDLAGDACVNNPEAPPLLESLLAAPARSWHATAHALVALARVAPARAAAPVRTLGSSARWPLRLYAARAAQQLRDSVTLWRLAGDSVSNVREAALSGLREVSGHAADAVYEAALTARDYQLVLSAATALAGTADRSTAATALLRALQRITRERSETSRDPRVALLVRLREVGGATLAKALRPYLRDFDPAVADSAASLLSAWTGKPVRAAPRPLPPLAVAGEEIERLRGKQLEFELEGGGKFTVELLVDAAPVTALRIARLVREGYYNGLSFHRVVPNFVIQGGSPGANEYAGFPRYLRDELSALSHERGTLGISTRGRDTGDAQLFINLLDNPRLDYEYTVWGRIVAGLATVDQVLEGDRILRVVLR